MPIVEAQTLEPVLIDRAGLHALGINFSNAHLLKLESENRFPRRLTLGRKHCCWMLAEIRAFIAERSSDRARAESLAANRKAARAGVAAMRAAGQAA